MVVVVVEVEVEAEVEVFSLVNLMDDDNKMTVK